MLSEEHKQYFTREYHKLFFQGLVLGTFDLFLAFVCLWFGFQSDNPTQATFHGLSAGVCLAVGFKVFLLAFQCYRSAKRLWL